MYYYYTESFYNTIQALDGKVRGRFREVSAMVHRNFTYEELNK